MKTTQILFIDTDIQDRQSVVSALQERSCNFEIEEVDSLAEFREHLYRNDYDLLLCGYNVLGFDDLEVLQSAKERNPEIPVLILAHTSPVEIAVRAIKMGAEDFIIKSDNYIQELISAINIAIENSRIVLVKDTNTRQRLEEKLKKREEMFSKVFEALPDAVAIISIEDQKFVKVNDGFLRIVNLKRNEVIGHTTAEINFWADYQSMLKYRDELHQNGNLKTLKSVIKLLVELYDIACFPEQLLNLITRNAVFFLRWIQRNTTKYEKPYARVTRSLMQLSLISILEVGNST